MASGEKPVTVKMNKRSFSPFCKSETLQYPKHILMSVLLYSQFSNIAKALLFTIPSCDTKLQIFWHVLILS